MYLDPDKFDKTISAYKREHWQPLLDLIPEIRDTASYGEVIDSERTEDGTFIFPYMKEAPVVVEFRHIVNRLGILVVFNWGAWETGYNMLNDLQFDFDQTDIPTKCKLITAVIRADRFNDGFLVSTFESGQMLQILKSIQKQVPLY